MTVEPYDIGTFLVGNRTPYLVDLWFREEKWSKAKPVCGCPDCFAKGFRPCKHILFLVNHLQQHDKTTKTTQENVS